jgi:hypothetical protein
VGKLTVIYWRDIPAQVIGQQGRTRRKKVLDDRFAAAIDRAAMRAGKGSSHAYLDEWRREGRSIEGDLETAVEQEVARLEAKFPEDLLEATVKAGGIIKQGSEK